MNPLLWVLLFLLAIAGGFAIFTIIWTMVTKSFDFIKIKRKIPKDKKKISEYIKENEDFFKSKPFKNRDIKEVEEDDKRKQSQFRQFEKLRRFANLKTGNNGKGQYNSNYERSPELQRRGLLSINSDPEFAVSSPRDSKSFSGNSFKQPRDEKGFNGIELD